MIGGSLSARASSHPWAFLFGTCVLSMRRNFAITPTENEASTKKGKGAAAVLSDLERHCGVGRGFLAAHARENE